MLRALRVASKISQAARLLEVPVSTGSSAALSKFHTSCASSFSFLSMSQNKIVTNGLTLTTNGGFNSSRVVSNGQGTLVKLGYGDGVIKVSYSKSFRLNVNGVSIEFKGSGNEKVTVAGEKITRESVTNITRLLGIAGVVAVGAGLYFFDHKTAADDKAKTPEAGGGEPQLK